MTSLLSVDNASFGYSPKRLVFEGITFDVKPGEVFCIVGPNGCGKSTLIDAVLGVNKLKSGSIQINGRDLKHLKPKEFAKNVAYVPQGHTKTFPYSVLDIVVMGRTHAARMFSSPDESERNRARTALNQVGLTGFEDRPYTELSGGEVQLVLVARALAQEAGILVMDEPTAHLDFRHELNVMEIVAKLVKERGLSIVMATHFLNQAFYLENVGANARVALMSGGGFKKIGTPSEVLNPENLEEVFDIVTWVGSSEHDGQKRKYIIPLKNQRG